MTSTSTSTRAPAPAPIPSTFWQGLHIACAVSAAIGLALLIWVWHPNQPAPDTVRAAAYHIFWVGFSCLVYLAVQAYTTLHTPAGSDRRLLADILLSSAPMLVIGYGLLDFARGHLPLNLFQGMTMSLWGMASAIDVLVFSAFSLRGGRSANH